MVRCVLKEPSNSQSMIKIGCDVVYMPRLEKHLNHKEWLDKILTLAEQNQYHSLKLDKRKLEYLCGRFACKEAYAKAMGKGIGDISFLDFEVLRQENGQALSNKGQVSISHDGDYAFAVVILDE